MRTLPAAAAALAILAGPAYAQITTGPEKDPMQLKYELEEKARQKADKEYEETMRRTRSSAPAQTVDPWRGVRTPDSKTPR